jgi:RES domain-containing protein
MTSLPAALGGGSGLIVWRLDQQIHAATWDSGEGAFRVGGRWNSKGNRAAYCSLDPAIAILEVAVHKGFKALDTVPYVITAARIADIAEVHVVKRDAVPNPNWLRPGIPGAGQQAFGDDLLRRHRFVAIPSAVSTHSWNLIFDPLKAKGFYSVDFQEPFALDTRLHPPGAK